MGGFSVIVLISILPVVLSGTAPIFHAIDENWVCNVKQSCVECLRLAQCSWCRAENRCFSKKIPNFDKFCTDNATDYYNYGLSFVDNARCACAGGHQDEDTCYRPGVPGKKCTGRGWCICGRCKCNSMPDPEHPNKMVMGEYCEYDNFSCEGPRCNEGPFLHNDADATNITTVDTDATSTTTNSTSIQPDQ